MQKRRRFNNIFPCKNGFPHGKMESASGPIGCDLVPNVTLLKKARQADTRP
jgi:hypothetical protein